MSGASGGDLSRASHEGLRIGMLTTTGDRCGIAAYTRALVAALSELPGTQVTVVPISEGRQPPEHYREQALLLNAPDIDVVHIQHEHSFWGGVLPRSSAFWELRYLINKPIVLTAHTTYSLAELLRLRAERRPHKWIAKKLLTLNKAYRDSVDTAPFATAVTIVHTEAARAELIARGVKPGYVSVVPTGIPAALPAPTYGDIFRRTFGLGDCRLLAIFGYTAPNKGYELTLQVLRDLPPDVALVIAGGPRNREMEPYRDMVVEKVNRLGLANRVKVTGFLSDAMAAEAMAAADLVLTPHTQATGSYSVAIPLTQGRPILASDLDCFREIRERMDCIELFRSGDAREYRAKVAALLGSPQRRQELSANARAYAGAYSWPNVARQTRDVYLSAVRVYARPHHAKAK